MTSLVNTQLCEIYALEAIECIGYMNLLEGDLSQCTPPTRGVTIILYLQELIVWVKYQIVYLVDFLVIYPLIIGNNLKWWILTNMIVLTISACEC